MSLLQLLKVGESLQAPKSGSGRFRMSPQAMPKFVPPKPPALPAPAPEPPKPASAPGETGMLFDLEPAGNPASPATTASSPDSPTPWLPSAPVVTGTRPASATGAGKAISAVPAKPAASTKPRTGPFSAELPLLRKYTSNAKRRGAHLETALEGLKVARNDLSDAGFEVVERHEKPGTWPFTLDKAGPRESGRAGWRGVWGRIRGIWGKKS